MKTKKFALLALATLVLGLIVPLCTIYATTKAATFYPMDDVYTLTINVVGTGCSVTPDTSQATYAYNDSVQLTPVAATGWSFSGWSGDVIGTENPLTVYMTSNMTVTALFVQDSYNVFVFQTNNGTISPGNATYSSGSNQDFTITPDTGFSIASITLDGQTVNVASPDGQTVSLVDIESDHSLTATFQPNNYTLTVYTVGEGSVTPNNATYPYGTTVTLTAAPANGWNLQSWSDNSTSLTDNITMSDNENITATFVQNPQSTPTPTPAPTPTTSPTPTSKPTTAPTPTVQPTVTPTPVQSTPLPTTSPPTPSPSPVSAGFGTYLPAIAAAIVLVGIVIGAYFYRKGQQTQ